MKNLLLSTAFILLSLPAMAAPQIKPTEEKANELAAKYPIPAPAPEKEDDAMPSQKSITAKTCADVKKAQQALDAVYAQVKKQYAYDPLFLKYLDQSQEAWNAYRDAELNAVYPPNYRESYGSVFMQCECLEATRLNNLRIDELNLWLGGTTHGNTCAGTHMQLQAAPPRTPENK